MDRDAWRAPERLPQDDPRGACGRTDGGLPDLRSLRQGTSASGMGRWRSSRCMTCSQPALADSEPQPRYAALQEISKFWVWIPGRSLTPAEERTLAEWKGGLFVPVVHCLASRDVATRVATVACLGTLPMMTPRQVQSLMSTTPKSTSEGRRSARSRSGICC